MKVTILAIFALAIGIAIGIYGTRREFDGEQIPTKLMLATLAERDTAIPSDGPRVSIEGGEIFDFGTLDRGSSGKHDFVFRNIGTKPLVITMGDTTCKCTAMSVDGKAMTKGSKQTIPPGESFKVTLEWLVKQAQPNFSQSAEFQTTDPRRPIVRLLIHGRTVEAIELSPSTLVFSGVTTEESPVGEVSIFSYRDEELKIVKHTLQETDSKDYFSVTFTPLAPKIASLRGARNGIAMQVSVKPGLPLGITRQQIVLTPSYEGMEPQVIPVEVKVVGDISLLGPKVPSGATFVNLGPVDQKAGATLTVYLHIKGPHRESTNIEIERLEPMGTLTAKLEAPVEISPTVKRIPIKIEIPAGAPVGNFAKTDGSPTGRIVLKTTHPTIKQMIIPVLFVVR